MAESGGRGPEMGVAWSVDKKLNSGTFASGNAQERLRQLLPTNHLSSFRIGQDFGLKSIVDLTTSLENVYVA